MASVTIFAASGCSITTKGIYRYKYIDDEYIVVEENGVNTLHKGSAEVNTALADYVQTGVSTLSFDCGEEIKTNQFVSYKHKPSEEKYDHKCEQCFE